jgi:hypothetical protein
MPENIAAGAAHLALKMAHQAGWWGQCEGCSIRQATDELGGGGGHEPVVAGLQVSG